jgi:hypothetical protein
MAQDKRDMDRGAGGPGGRPYLLSLVSTTAFRSHSWWSRNSLLRCASFSSALSRMPRKIFSNCLRCLTVAAIASAARARPARDQRGGARAPASGARARACLSGGVCAPSSLCLLPRRSHCLWSHCLWRCR